MRLREAPSAAEADILNQSAPAQVAADSPTWHSAAAAQKLAASMLDIYSGLRSSLSQDEHRHYLLTPRHLTQWVQGLQRYSLRGTDVLQVKP